MRRRFLSYFLFLGLALFASLLVFSDPLHSQEESFPSLKVHPLPATLAHWQDRENRGDYFEAVESTAVGALVWSEFPVKVYVKNDRASWPKLARQAIEEWGQYLPLLAVNQVEIADIVIERSFPPSGVRFNAETGKLDLPRVRSAQTQYEVFFKDTILGHRMTIQISPNLSESSVLAAMRHELGHALGIWGHSSIETDVLYFSQTRDIPSISVRDVNTLKRVYEQATRLGWPIE